MTAACVPWNSFDCYFILYRVLRVIRPLRVHSLDHKLFDLVFESTSLVGQVESLIGRVRRTWQLGWHHKHDRVHPCVDCGHRDILILAEKAGESLARMAMVGVICCASYGRWRRMVWKAVSATSTIIRRCLYQSFLNFHSHFSWAGHSGWLVGWDQKSLAQGQRQRQRPTRPILNLYALTVCDWDCCDTLTTLVL